MNRHYSNALIQSLSGSRLVGRHGEESPNSIGQSARERLGVARRRKVQQKTYRLMYMGKASCTWGKDEMAR